MLRVPKGETAAVTSRLLTDLSVLDLTIEDPPIEDIISQVFGGATRATDGATTGEATTDDLATDAQARTPPDEGALTP